jgi:hypothetical protein
VSLNRLYEVGRAPVVEEEDPLTEPPEWGGPEFIHGRAAQYLGVAVRTRV